jgi:murein L,D-transpeptidase YafK
LPTSAAVPTAVAFVPPPASAPDSLLAGWINAGLFSRDSAQVESASAPLVPASGASRAATGWQFTAGRIASASLLVAMLVVLAMAAVQTRAARPQPAAADSSNTISQDSALVSTLQQSAEARLIEIYRLIGAADAHGALAHAESLVNDSPNFQLAQLVYGDLLLAQGAPLDSFGQGAGKLGSAATAQLSQLQQEAVKRLHALRAAPPMGTVPSAFVQLASTTRHAVAVDATHSRLYVFENRASGPVLASSHYIATGRQGVGKRREGDLRTPLGVYFISGRLDARDLDDFYGVGALPLNYPNEHDRRHGRTGADIWVHGTPSAQHSPAPDSTNGCIVLANDDLRALWRELSPQNTPVVIARHLDWVTPASLATQKRELLGVLENWRAGRSAGDVQRAMALYSVDFRLGEATSAESRRHVERELAHGAARERELREVTVLSWQDEGDRAVISFTEIIRGSRKGVMHRQYWNHEQGHWKLYSEGVLE